MPPSTWMQSLASGAKASSARRRRRGRQRGGLAGVAVEAAAASHATAGPAPAATSMSAQRCFTRLELADGPAELAPVPGVGGGGVDAPGGAAGASAAASATATASTRPGSSPGSGDPGGRPSSKAMGQAPGGVEGATSGGGGVRPLDDRPALLRPRSPARRPDVGERAAQHGTGGAGAPQRAVVAALASIAAVERDRADPPAGGQVGAVPGPDQRRRPARWAAPARGHGPARLLEHHGQLGVAVALAAVGLGHGEAEPAEPGQLVPERRQRLDLRLEGGSGDGGRAALGGEPPDGGQQRRGPRRWRCSRADPPPSSNDHVTLAGLYGCRSTTSRSRPRRPHHDRPPRGQERPRPPRLPRPGRGVAPVPGRPRRLGRHRHRGARSVHVRGRPEDLHPADHRPPAGDRGRRGRRDRRLQAARRHRRRAAQPEHLQADHRGGRRAVRGRGHGDAGRHRHPPRHPQAPPSG